MFVLGLDIGGTKVEAALLEFREEGGEGCQRYYLPTRQREGFFKTIGRQRIPTQRSRGYEPVLEDIANMIRGLMAEHKLTMQDVSGMGLAVPGSMDPKSHRMIIGSTGILIGKDLAGDLCSLLQWQGPVSVENDASCFAWAEACAGAGRRFGPEIGEKTVLGIILGTGVGGGAVINGRLISGRRGGAAEWGHTVLFPEGAPCYCGNNGCTERFLSGPGLEAQYAQVLYEQVAKRPSAGEIFAMAEAMEPMAIAVVKQYQRHLSRFLATLSQCFDPDLIVLGGGVSKQEAIYQGLSETMTPFLFVKEAPPEVVQHELGDAAGVVGACLLLPLT